MNLRPIVPSWRPSRDNLLDHRVEAFRPDLADAALRGRVDASHYSEVTGLICTAERATIYLRPDIDSVAVSELAMGEDFRVVERGAQWLWGWCGHDHYTGYAEAAKFGSQTTPTHRVSSRVALVFSEASIKSPVVSRPPLGSLVSVDQVFSEAFYRTDRGFIHRRHLSPIRDFADDPVEVALRLVGSPYLWGGRTGEGIDCSGLIQVSLSLCGIASPRDCDQQMVALGASIDPVEARRGDLVFFPGHVGIMTDGASLLHANAFWMTTMIEPLADVVSRLAPNCSQPILAVKRL